jgi:hypothetical protein
MARRRVRGYRVMVYNVGRARPQLPSVNGMPSPPCQVVFRTDRQAGQARRAPGCAQIGLPWWA